MSMEYYTFSLLFFLPIIFNIIYSRWTTKSTLPPGPKPLPIIGNIHQLGNMPHRAVANLSKIYGPIMTLKLGSRTTIVISSSKILHDVFLKHDLAFSGRVVPQAGKTLNHDKISVIWLPVCPKWRQLRKIATIQLFTTQKLDASRFLREKIMKELVEYVQKCCETRVPVDIGKAGFTTTLNLLSNTLFSKNLASYVSSYPQEFRDLVTHLSEEAGKPNVSDFFPLLGNLDLQGVLKRCTITYNKIFAIFDEIIDARLKGNSKGINDDVLKTLLKLVEDQELSLDEVKHLLFDLFVAGTDTTSNTLEWAMTELLRNSEKMSKVQIEMDKVLDTQEQLQESDIAKLPYLQAVVKETFRLHAPTPFLVPHKSENDVQLGGYLVPKNSSIWVNIWSINRESSVWSNPEMFIPERFLEKEIDIKGRNFELIPFGSGRRICPGMPLAQRMLHLMLATLLKSFNWKHVYENGAKEINMEEKFGITLQKLEPLQAIPVPK
ncbi:cytochrome P450 76AD1-like [Amaranthus tricolor]|uniref:cytochrome P450 76AD1-like n=1 Tax=Amaranthus tricolor TaxID=29722 RepID=UPI00258E3842|nr:cytochrome P450 76AD1-like [Amaranthus tricolor]